MEVRLYKAGNRWYLQEIKLGNLIGSFGSKKDALHFVSRNKWSLVS